MPTPNWHKPAPARMRTSEIGEATRHRLQALREAAGMSQAELARHANMAPSTLSRLESGRRGLNVSHLPPLAAALGVAPEELVALTTRSRTAADHAGPQDLDLRRLRYFVALAEELHFGRAAERLSITQPVLSRQVRKLEQELGVDLLARSNRHVELTGAGRQLVEDAKPILASADALGRRARRAAGGRTALAVGFMVGDPIIPLVRAFIAAHPGTEVDVHRIYRNDQHAALLNDHLDVSFVHLPIDDAGLDLAYLYSSPMMALLPVGHRLAHRSGIASTELAGDPVVRDLEEKIEVVAIGRAIGFVPVSVTAGIQIPPEVTAIPVTDTPPAEVCLAWRSGRRSETIRDLVATAVAILAR